MNKNYILFLLHLPPPVHGSSIVGENIKKNSEINRLFDCVFINILISNRLNETGRFHIKKMFFSISIFFKIFFLLMRRRPHLCYLALTTTGLSLYKDVMIIGLLKFFRIKMIYHLHNKGVKIKQERKLCRLVYNFIFENSEVIILSNLLYSDINTTVKKSNVHICPNGISDQITEVRNEHLHDGNSKKVRVSLLFFSNLMESKGVLVLMKAFVLLFRRGILFEGVIVGNEGDVTLKRLNNLRCELGLNEIVKLYNGKYGVEKSEAFLKADIFVLPTLNDCFPLVILEAMSYSLPIVSTVEGGIPDIVEENRTGFLVPKNDVNALTDKLELLINSSELRFKMGTAGRKKFEREFTIEKFESRIGEILQSVAEK
ncbi:MAG: glycosyltransferase [Chitinophagaceae bacterium]|nr:glycosyltransferase [Chitinophagaceae bacterium]